MPVIDVGRVCVKVRGREAGRKCVVIRIIDENFVEVTGPKEITGVRRRRANVKHLVPLPIKLDLEEGASDEEVAEALEERGLVDEMRERVKIEV